MSDEPFPEIRGEAKTRRDAEARQLVKDYKATFGSGAGVRVLADLRRRFGWMKWEAVDSEDADVIARRVCMKGPLYHIEEKLQTTFRAAPKPNKARSGSHHDNDTAPPP